MNSFVLKLIAICTMFIDHLRYIIPTQPMFMSCIGRISFPIFSFQIVQGYLHTRNLKKYILRLFIVAIISQIPYYLYFHNGSLNVLFTLILGLLCIYTYEKFAKKSKFLTITVILLIMLLSYYFKCDYSYYGISIILVFYILREHKIIMSITFLIVTAIYYIIKYLFLSTTDFIWLYCSCALSLIPCLLYNGKQGPKIKYLFYLFYPVHLSILLLFAHL